MFSESQKYNARTILHIDGDCFFASCEVAKNPALRGLPVVVGQERGMATALTYEAKALGIKRGMPMFEIKKICPSVIILPSDYETYSLYSKRMFSIVRRYTPVVEEYSIDECFAELTGLRRSLRMRYDDMAEKIKHDLDTELGMTFSVGLAPTKVLAKLGSKWKKPSGLTIIHADTISRYLDGTPIGKIWGIGPQTESFLLGHGIKTALQFVEKPEWWINEKLTKPHQEIWHELRGESVYPLSTEEKDDYHSISKTKTFTPPSSDKDFVFSELSKNIENACIKARRHKLVSKEISIFLKTQDFKYHGLDIKLSRDTNIPKEMLDIARNNFDKVYSKGTLYRSTGVILTKLSSGECSQPDLFGGTVQADAMKRVYQEVDKVDAKYGKHTIFLGSSFLAIKTPAHQNDRGAYTERAKTNLQGEHGRKHLGIPMLGEVS